MSSKPNPKEQLEQRVFAALETYSNVHRGSGHKSQVTTMLYEEARNVVLSHLKLDAKKYRVVFCSPRRSESITAQLSSAHYKRIKSTDLGLQLGVHALAIFKSPMLQVLDLDQGGGTARMVGDNWIVQAKGEDRFEAGTPAVINVIALAVALQLTREMGRDCFKNVEWIEDSSSQDYYKDLKGEQLIYELRKSVIGRSVIVPTNDGAKPYINLDNSASTSAFMPVWDAFRNHLMPSEGNTVVEETKSVVSKFLNAPQSEYEIDFVSNTTEAVNEVANRYFNNYNGEPVVLSSYLEHSSNDLPWRKVNGAEVVRISFDEDGFFNLKQMEKLLQEYNIEKKHGSKRIAMVALNGASNVMGVCNALQEVCDLAHRYEAKVFVDAAQLVAHRSVDIEKLTVDFLGFSGHKIYAPFGAGVLVHRSGLLSYSSEELALKDEQAKENVAGIAALQQSLRLLMQVGMDVVAREEEYLAKYTLEQFSIMKDIKLKGIQSASHLRFESKLAVFPFDLGNKVPFGVARELAYRRGIGVRVGCHCAHMLVKKVVGVSKGLEKFQRFIQRFFNHTIFPGVIRVSLGIENTTADIDVLVHTLNEISGAKSSVRIDKKKAKTRIDKFNKSREQLVFG